MDIQESGKDDFLSTAIIQNTQTNESNNIDNDKAAKCISTKPLKITEKYTKDQIFLHAGKAIWKILDSQSNVQEGTTLSCNIQQDEESLTSEVISKINDMKMNAKKKALAYEEEIINKIKKLEEQKNNIKQDLKKLEKIDFEINQNIIDIFRKRIDFDDNFNQECNTFMSNYKEFKNKGFDFKTLNPITLNDKTPILRIVLKDKTLHPSWWVLFESPNKKDILFLLNEYGSIATFDINIKNEDIRSFVDNGSTISQIGPTGETIAEKSYSIPANIDKRKTSKAFVYNIKKIITGNQKGLDITTRFEEIDTEKIKKIFEKLSNNKENICKNLARQKLQKHNKMQQSQRSNKDVSKITEEIEKLTNQLDNLRRFLNLKDNLKPCIFDNNIIIFEYSNKS